MRIVHICVLGTYNDYWGYQDNLLPHYHRVLNHDVTVIASNKAQDQGQVVEVPESDYILKDGVRVIRIKQAGSSSNVLLKYLNYYKVLGLLNDLQPDFIMMHGLASLTVRDVVKYKKAHMNCNLVADNHMDLCNTSFKTFKTHMLRLYYKYLNKANAKYFGHVYGVTPARVEYAVKQLGVPKEKCELLVMGGDDENIHFADKKEITEALRSKINIDLNDFLIVTGGKMDRKKNIHLLIQAITEINDPHIHLVIFGLFDDEMNSDYAANNIHYVGWIPANEAYDWFLTSDLAVFPGTHSVLWEQAVACGIPCVFKYWKGMEHVDVGGNCRFLYKESSDEIKQVLSDIVYDINKYRNMKSIAIGKGIMEFSYSEIAKKVLNY